jgi:hypothetical protein
MRAVDFLCDLITLSEYVPLGLIVTIVCILSLVFYFVPFGVVFCGAIFIAMMNIGFNLIFSKTPWRREEGNAMKGAATGETGPIRIYETFRDAFRKRFLWRNPRTHSRQRSSSSPPQQCSLSATPHSSSGYHSSSSHSSRDGIPSATAQYRRYSRLCSVSKQQMTLIVREVTKIAFRRAAIYFIQGIDVDLSSASLRYIFVVAILVMSSM